MVDLKARPLQSRKRWFLRLEPPNSENVDLKAGPLQDQTSIVLKAEPLHGSKDVVLKEDVVL